MDGSRVRRHSWQHEQRPERGGLCDVSGIALVGANCPQQSDAHVCGNSSDDWFIGFGRGIWEGG
jgi:hypothetical protein